MRRRGLAAAAFLVLLAGCARTGPEDIDTATDVCSRCRMSIDRLSHAGEMMSADGRLRKYDSLGCLALDYSDQQQAGLPRGVWVIEYQTSRWLDASEAWFALAGLKTDHMGYGIAAASSREAALRLTGGSEDRVVRWQGLYKAVLDLEQRRHE